MSRLTEALGRSGTRKAQSSQEVFNSPWSLAEEVATVAVSTEAPVATQTIRPAEVPAAGPRLVVTSPMEGFKATWKEWLLPSDADPSLVEQFKRLAAALLHAERDRQSRVIMVTSAVPGEGKTLTALNLALVLAHSYRRRVLLIDADLRRPRLSEAVSGTVADGLGEALKANDNRKVSIMQLTDWLTLLPAGRPDPEPLSGLTSPRMQHLLEEASERFEWVIVDTPPIAAAADASLLCEMVDLTVLVVRAGQTAYPAVRQAIDAIGRDRIFGVVLNGVDRQNQQSYSPYPYKMV